MATALDKLARLASAEQGAGKELLQLFSTHPDSAERAGECAKRPMPRAPVRQAEALAAPIHRIRRSFPAKRAAHGARFRNGGFQERVMKNFIITVVFIVTRSISFAQSEPRKQRTFDRYGNCS